MEEISQGTPGLHAGEQGAVMILNGATEPERVLAANLREARKERGMTQKAVAEGMGFLGFSMMHTTIAKIEAGERPIRVNESFGLAAVVGVNIVELLGLPQSAKGAEIMASHQTTNKLQKLQAEILNDVQEMEREHRRRLRKYLTDRLAELGSEEGE
jgi:transcriptional regulator with XRE-family HTH domain